MSNQPDEEIPPEAVRVFTTLAEDVGDLELLDAVLAFVAQNARARAAGSAEQRAPRYPDSFAYLISTLGRDSTISACISIVGRYARPGAVRALGRRKGDGSIACPDCRGRAAMAKQVTENLRRYHDGRTQGSGASTTPASEEASA